MEKGLLKKGNKPPPLLGEFNFKSRVIAVRKGRRGAVVHRPKNIPKGRPPSKRPPLNAPGTMFAGNTHFPPSTPSLPYPLPPSTVHPLPPHVPCFSPPFAWLLRPLSHPPCAARSSPTLGRSLGLSVVMHPGYMTTLELNTPYTPTTP